jgi:hypothetical protein
MLPLALAGPLAAQVPQSNDIVKFRLRDGYLILVQTRINGVGPFDFLLDTGTTRTVIDPDLARQLQAPVIGEVSLTGVLQVRQDKLVRLKDVRLGEASLTGVGAAVDKLTRQKMLASGIRGVLGETTSSTGCASEAHLPPGSDVDSRRSVNIMVRPRPTACSSLPSLWK